jgi:hypothetical protein
VGCLKELRRAGGGEVLIECYRHLTTCIGMNEGDKGVGEIHLQRFASLEGQSHQILAFENQMRVNEKAVNELKYSFPWKFVNATERPGEFNHGHHADIAWLDGAQLAFHEVPARSELCGRFACCKPDQDVAVEADHLCGFNPAIPDSAAASRIASLSSSVDIGLPYRCVTAVDDPKHPIPGFQL